MTDTPETDTPESDKAKIAFTSLFASDDAYWVPFIVARKLERERDEAQERADTMFAKHVDILDQTRNERDEARGQLAGIENKMRGELGGHPDSELWGDAGLIAATMRCVDAIGEVTDQRDEWKAKYIKQNKDLGCEMMDPNGTIWDYAKKLQAELDEARVQLRKAQVENDHNWQAMNLYEAERVLADRLAALLQRDRYGHGGQVVDPECDCCDCKWLKPIDEVLAAWKEARSESALP